MRAIYLIIAIFGVAHGAMPQQRSPVYPSSTTVGAPINTNQVKSPNPVQQQVTPATAPVSLPQVAQAREGSVPVEGVSPAAGASNVPGSSQVNFISSAKSTKEAPY